MSTRLGTLESVKGLSRGVDREDGKARSANYASFVVRGWRPGRTGTLEVAHDQSGERIRAASLVEVIGWIQARSVRATVPGYVAPAGEYRERLEAGSDDCGGAAAA